jgi:TrmH family RNA methyltransferase
VKILSSIHNPELKRLRLLIQKSRERKKQKRFVIEGEREILKAILGGYQLESIFIYEGSASHFSALLNKIPTTKVHSVSPTLFQQLSIRSGSEKILAISHSKTHELSQLKINRNSLILVLEAPEKPGNIGALYRTATAAQIDAVLIANPKTDFYNPNSIRSSLGSLFLMPTAMGSSEQIVSFLRRNQFQIATAALHQDAIAYDAFDYTPPCALVMGTESTGLNNEWLENTDQHLIIPMDKSIDSLNLSVSAGILMYEAIKHK